MALASDRLASLSREWANIIVAAALTGPATWPMAAALLARQQGSRAYSWLELVRSSGARAAFRGCVPYSSYKVLGIGTQRGVQAPVLVAMEGADSIPISLRHGLAGVASGVVGGFIVTAVEQAKISLANGDFRNAREMRAFLFSPRSGWRHALAGARATMARNVMFDSINAVMYFHAVALPGVDRTSAVHMAAVNAVCGLSTAVLDYPLDVIKTRIQASVVPLARAVPPQRPLGVWATLVATVGQGGWRLLYAGLSHKIGLYFAVWGVYGAAYGAAAKVLQPRS